LQDVFTSKKAKAQETQPDTPVDESRLYYEAAGGYDKKGRVFGMGSAAPMYYDRPAAAARHSSAETYAPGIVTRLTQEMARDREIHAQTQARVEELERDRKRQEDRLAQMEEFITQRLGSIPPDGCNPGTRQHRDDRSDHGPGGSDMGLGTTQV
jgi:hypothetical protein